jgi:hypothetical protein
MQLKHLVLFTTTALALAVPEPTAPAQLARAVAKRGPGRNNEVAHNNSEA